jgi:molybdopterin-guanine dinucleotide biosynthesis protein B
MIPILAVVGSSGSGKTTLICKLVEELTRRGRRVATVKHHPGEFKIDREGKDTFRHRAAGAVQVMISSPRQLALIRNVQREISLDEIADTLVVEADLLLAEGYKEAPIPKIEVFRKEQPEAWLVCGGDPRCQAIISDTPLTIDKPVLDLNNAGLVADFIEERFLAKRRPQTVKLLVNGRRVPLNEFSAKMVASVVRGAVGALKGGENPQSIRLEVAPDAGGSEDA